MLATPQRHPPPEQREDRGSAGEQPRDAPAPKVEDPSLDDEAMNVAEWVSVYANWTKTTLAAEVVRLENEISLLEALGADEREEAGLYEVVSSVVKEDVAGGDTEGEAVVYSVTPDNEIRRIVLPRPEYPEVYASKRKLAWLRNEVQRARQGHSDGR